MSYQFLDTFHNFLSGLGMPGRDKMTAFRYAKPIWTRDQLEASYQSDWIARKAIVIPAHDATREWRSWQAEQPQIEKLEETEKRLNVQLKLQMALVKARLYGSCCILIGVDGNMEKELDPEMVKKDGLKFIHVLAPHQLVIEQLEKDIESPYYGQPTFYKIQDDSKKIGDVKIHPSRMIRLIGLDTPDPMINFGWGDPLMQVIHDAVAAAGTVTQSVAALVNEAKFDIIKIPGLTEVFSTADATARLVKRFTEANVAKSVINGIVLDAEEEWQRIGVNFTGMPEVLQMYLQIAAGAADIPVTRFLGMSPAGLNATGESDLQNYYDRIASDQELRLTPALEKLDKSIQRSALGKFDKNIFYEWNPLWQMTSEQKASIAKQKADTAMVDANSGLIPFEALVKGRCNQLIEDGVYPGLEAAIEEAIANMDMPTEEPPQDELQGPPKLLPPPGGGGGKPPGGKDITKQTEAAGDSVLLGENYYTYDEVRAGLGEQVAMRLFDVWHEPSTRGQPDNAGKFGPGGGPAPPTPAEKSRKATAALAGKNAGHMMPTKPAEFVAARDKSDRPQFLSAHPAEELTQHKLLMNHEGTVGISVDPKGDIQNVFNNGGPKGGASKAMVSAIEAGGKTLDCYEGHLNEYYHQFGFEEDARMKFNKDFAPEGWDFDAHNSPDIVFMSWRGYLDKENGATAAIARAASGRGTPQHGWEKPERSTNYVTDWDAAKEQSRTNATEAKGVTGTGAKAEVQRGGKQPDKNAGGVKGKVHDRAGAEPRRGSGAGYRRNLRDAKRTEWVRNAEGEFGSGAANRAAKGARATRVLARAALRSEAQSPMRAKMTTSSLMQTLKTIHSVAAMRGKGVAQATGETSGKHPGKGYSKDAFVDRNGVLHTNNVYDAQRALFEDRRVELNQPKMVSTLIKRLGETALEMAEGGSAAPTFNLCNVSIKGTNLFCADQIGIPRVEMPVIRASKTKDFVKYLEEQGYKVEEGKEKAANLRASQSELSGEKVAASMKRIEDEGKFYKRIVISKDDYILDGHHTWAGQLAHDAADNDLHNDGRQVKIARIDIGIIDLIKEAETWTGGKGKKAASEAAKGLGDAIDVLVSQIEDLLRHGTKDVALNDLDVEFGEEPYSNGFFDVAPWNEGAHQRNEEGEFGSGAANREAKNKAALKALKHQPTEADIAKELKLEPKAVDVGGDEWNKVVAVRLETEYQSAKPEMEALLNSYLTGERKPEKGAVPTPEEKEPEFLLNEIGEEVYPEDPGYENLKIEHDKWKELQASLNQPEEEEEPKEYEGIPEPESWDLLGDDAQSSIEQEYYEKALPDYIESEQTSWHDGGGSLDQAKGNLADDEDWLKEALVTDWLGEKDDDGVTAAEEMGLKFTPEQIYNAVSMRYDNDGEGGNDPTVEFDDKLLHQMKGEEIGVPKEQLKFEGIPEPDYSKLLTEKQREEITATLVEAFNTKAENMAPDEEPPDFSDQAKEYMEENYSSMDDEEKYQWAKFNTSIINDLQEQFDKEYAAFQTGDEPPAQGKIGIPNKFDPLNTTSGEDYKRTQQVARRMSLDRAIEVYEERGIEMKPGVVPMTAMRRLDSDLWSAWKGSSTSEEGLLLQVAVADELGGRLNPTTGRGGSVKIDKDAIRKKADKDYEGTGGYDGIKAYVRAKWETTQFLLDKANMHELELYRGINLDRDKYEQAVATAVKVRGQDQVPQLRVQRNGAASTTFNADVANGWSSDDTRVVLRALMPRTAAVSIPAYGINVKSEQEVVVAGTAWKKWDAWLKKAPRISDVAMA